MRSIVILVLVLVLGNVLKAQDGSLVRSHISFEYGGQVPLADMRDRFGANFNLSSQFELLHIKWLWHAGVKGYYLFGATVKEDVLAILRTPEFHIIGNDRVPATVFLRERGFYIGPYVGRIFRLSEENPLSGIKASFGAGLLQHRVRIQDDSRSVTQLTGEYIKGYDRLTNGMALYAFLGYQNLDVQNRMNFLAGFDLTVGFTRSRRDFDFSTQMRDTSSRLDILLGFRLGWILPITTGKDPDDIYY